MRTANSRHGCDVRLLGADLLTKHFKAPAADFGLLEEPPRRDYPQLLEINLRRDRNIGQWSGISLPELRIMARRELLGMAMDNRPILMAGHQPELYHPGVWAKNFVLAGAARQLNAHAVNLIVDNDTMKQRFLRVPHLAAEPADVSLEKIPFDESLPEVPYEEAFARNWDLLDRFQQQLQRSTASWNWQPLANEVWPRIIDCLKQGKSYARAVVAARLALERKWGVNNTEIAVSDIAGYQSFAVFVHELARDAQRFADAYNTAIRAYRAANGIESKNHPAPELQSTTQGYEIPFWAWQADNPTRQRIFATQRGGYIDLFVPDRPPFVSLKIVSRPEEVHAALQNCGWKIRPRALTLTIFARMVLSDLFIHGIGGGKYDEVTDAIIRQSWGFTPPEYAVISQTIRLPLERYPVDQQAITKQHRLLRDLTWNPQQFAAVQEQATDLAQQKQMLIQQEPTTKHDRRVWYRQLSQITQQLRQHTVNRVDAETARQTRLINEFQANTSTLARRDFSWILFPNDLLQNCFKKLLD